MGPLSLLARLGQIRCPQSIILYAAHQDLRAVRALTFRKLGSSLLIHSGLSGRLGVPVRQVQFPGLSVCLRVRVLHRSSLSVPQCPHQILGYQQ